MPKGQLRKQRHVAPLDWPHVMAVAREVFSAHNDYGVFAFGMGPCVTDGRTTDKVTLNTYVEYKHPAPRKAVPTIEVRVGRRLFSIVPNVIATGRRPRHTFSDQAPFSGLYPGAPIRVDGPPRGYGGVACFLGQGGQATHLLTAGHLFPPNAIGAPVFAAADDAAAPVVVGTMAANLLDAGSIDAAAVALTDAGLEMMSESHDGPGLRSCVPAPAVFLKPCRAFRPTTRDFSRSSQTTAGPMDVFLESEPRGAYWARDTVGTDGTISDVGDSGSVLCTGSMNQFAMGILVGEFQSHSVAEPIGRAIQELASLLGSLGLVPTTPG